MYCESLKAKIVIWNKLKAFGYSLSFVSIYLRVWIKFFFSLIPESPTNPLTLLLPFFPLLVPFPSCTLFLSWNVLKTRFSIIYDPPRSGVPHLRTAACSEPGCPSGGWVHVCLQLYLCEAAGTRKWSCVHKHLLFTCNHPLSSTPTPLVRKAKKVGDPSWRS